jgi:hypothetical protein
MPSFVTRALDPYGYIAPSSPRASGYPQSAVSINGIAEAAINCGDVSVSGVDPAGARRRARELQRRARCGGAASGALPVKLGDHLRRRPVGQTPLRSAAMASPRQHPSTATLPERANHPGPALSDARIHRSLATRPRGIAVTKASDFPLTHATRAWRRWVRHETAHPPIFPTTRRQTWREVQFRPTSGWRSRLFFAFNTSHEIRCDEVGELRCLKERITLRHSCG